MLTCLLALAIVTASEPIDKQYDMQVDGTTLHVHVRGTDASHPYVLFLHGGPGFSSLPFMATTGADLEPTVNMVYLDQRGCGLSPRLKRAELKACTMAAMLDDLEAVRKQLGIEKWGVIAHDFGGTLAFRYAAEHSDRVSWLVGISSIVSVPAMTDDMLANASARAGKWAETGTGDQKAAAPRLLGKIDRLKPLSQKDPRRLSGAMDAAMNQAQLDFANLSSEVVKASLQRLLLEAAKYKIPLDKLDLAPEPSLALVENDSYQTMDATKYAQKVSAPTLLIGGRQDGVVTARQLEIARRAIKSAHLELLDNCGHFAFYEQPAKLLEALLRFIQRPK